MGSGRRLSIDVHCANAEVLERVVFVERDRLFRGGHRRRIGESEDQRAGCVVMDVAGLVFVVAMDVTVEDGHIVIGRQHVHYVIAIAGEPLPVRTQVKQWTVGEDNNRRCFREAGEVLLQPCKLFGADLGLGAGNVVERNEVHAAMVEGVVALAEELAIESAAVEAGVMLAGHVLDRWHVHALGDFQELPHALRVDILVFGVMGQISREEHEVWAPGEGVDHVDGMLKCLGAERVGRAIETNVGIAELHEGEGRDLLAILTAQNREHVPDPTLGESCGVSGVEHADAERCSGDFEE